MGIFLPDKYYLVRIAKTKYGNNYTVLLSIVGLAMKMFTLVFVAKRTCFIKLPLDQNKSFKQLITKTETDDINIDRSGERLNTMIGMQQRPKFCPAVYLGIVRFLMLTSLNHAKVTNWA